MTGMESTARRPVQSVFLLAIELARGLELRELVSGLFSDRVPDRVPDRFFCSFFCSFFSFEIELAGGLFFRS